MVRAGSAVPCACFGARQEPMTVVSVLRNALLAACASGLLVAGAGPGGLTQILRAAPLGAAVAFLLARATDLNDLVTNTRLEKRTP